MNTCPSIVIREGDEGDVTFDIYDEPAGDIEVRGTHVGLSYVAAERLVAIITRQLPATKVTATTTRTKKKVKAKKVAKKVKEAA